jgi:hypothetical protein
VRVTKRVRNAELRYESTPFLGLRATWEIHFSEGGNPGETEVREVLAIPLGRLGRTALAGLGKYPGEEVLANLKRLKQTLESDSDSESGSTPGTDAGPESGSGSGGAAPSD